MRSDMDHSFTCKLRHACLYSPAAGHHRPLAGTVPRKVGGSVDLGGWLGLYTEIKCRLRGSNPDTVTHPSTNRTQRRLTSLIETNALPLRLTGLSACRSHGCTVQKRPNRSRCRLGTDSCGLKEPRVSWVEIPPRQTTILEGCPAHKKHWESLLRCMQQKRSGDRSILSNSTIYDVAFVHPGCFVIIQFT